MNRKREILWLTLPILILGVPGLMRLRASKPVKSAPPIAPPYFVTYNLAQMDLRAQKWGRWGEWGAKCDLKSKYCLTSSDGPDGCEWELSLKPLADTNFSRGSWRWNGADMEDAFGAARLNLVTGRGVKIGDTRQAVLQKLQKMGEISDSRNNSIVYRFEGKRRYRAIYTFRKNKLVAITFYSGRILSGSNSVSCGP